MWKKNTNDKYVPKKELRRYLLIKENNGITTHTSDNQNTGDRRQVIRPIPEEQVDQFQGSKRKHWMRTGLVRPPTLEFLSNSKCSFFLFFAITVLCAVYEKLRTKKRVVLFIIYYECWHVPDLILSHSCLRGFMFLLHLWFWL